MTDITSPSMFDSVEGQAFKKQVEKLITDHHEKAEKDPDHSRDFVQRAAGVRDVLQIIQSTVPTKKKP